MPAQSKVYAAASIDVSPPTSPSTRRLHAKGSSEEGDEELSPTTLSGGAAARKYQPVLKSGASSSQFDRPPSQRLNQPAPRIGNLCRPRWLLQRFVVRPIQRKYRKLSWTTRTTASSAISLFAVLYVLFTVPFRLGFLYNPFGSFNENDKWTSELKTFLPVDLVVDAIGLLEFVEFYRVWRDAFSQLSNSVAFELGKKLERDARAKSPRIHHRARKASSVMRSSKSKWNLTTITPPVTSVAAANKNYREKRLQFVLEIIAVLPLEVFPLATRQLNALHLVRVTKLCRLYRLKQNLDRIGKIYSDSKWVQQLSYTGISGLVKRIVVGAVLVHWFACGYMLVGHSECGVHYEFCSADKQTSWVVRDQLLGGTLARKYARSLYWASRTMVLLGYDDVTPVSDVETIYAIIVQVIGALLSTSILAMFQFIFRYRNARQAAFSAHVDNAREYMKSQNIPRAVRRQVMEYFSYAQSTHHGLDSEAALRLMPRHLQSKVVYTLKASRVKQVCFLMKESVEFINHLALALRHRVYSPSDMIIEPKINAKMFFVIRGTVILSAFDGSGTKQCGTGDFFADSCLLEPDKYEEKAVAKTFCELYVLEKASLDAAIVHFYRGHEKETHDRMADVLDKYATQLRKTKKLLGLRGGGEGDESNSVSGTSGSDLAWLGTAWRLPGSALRMRWDILRFLAIVGTTMEVPYYLVFIANDDAERNFLVEQEHGMRYATTILVEVFFLVDLVLRARFFAYLDPTVMLNVVDSSMIFAAYKANGFYADLVALVPISLIVETIRGTIEGYLWMFRLVRLLRLRYAMELLLDLGDYYGTSSKAQFVVTLILGVIFTLHMVGCMWFVMAWIPLLSNGDVATTEPSGATSDLTRQSCLYMATHFQNCSWITYDCYGHIGWAFPIEDAGSHYKTYFAYLRSVYWAVVALTAVGYGDIVAFSTAESYFAALWIFVGGIINFGVVGAMSSILSNLMASQHHHVEKINTLNSIMEQLHISEALREEIRHFYHKQFSSRKRAYESQLLSHLPDQLCYQISSLLHSESTRRVALFSLASREFLDEVTGKFRYRTYQHGETIVLEGDVCKEFFVILHGKVNVFFQSKRVPIGAYHDGDCYGVNEFLLQRPHPTTLTAVSQVHASVMTREHFDAVLLKFTDDMSIIRDEAHELYHDDMARLRRIAQNLENAKFQPHVIATTSMFYQKESSSLRGGISKSHSSASSSYRDPDALRTSIHNSWDAVITLANVYNAFVVIFRIAFHSHMHLSAGLFTAMALADIVCDLLFAADIYLQLYYFGCDEVGLENLLHRTVVDTRYRKSAGFKVDLLASLPLYVVDSHHPFASAMCRLPRLLRCYSLWTCIDNMIIQVQQMFASQNVSSYLSPLKLLFFLLLIAHYAASIFFLISDYECRYSKSCWLETDHMLHIYHHSIGALYIRSFYWALTTLTLVGSREIVPRGSLGTMWATLTCISCTFVMGHILGELSDLIIDMNKEEKEHKRRVESFESFAKEHALPEVLRERVALFFKAQLAQTHGKDLHETLHDLSANLKLKLMHEMYGASIGMLPISRFLSHSQVNNLALRLSSEMFIPGDDIVSEDTFGHRLCIMRKGQAGVYWTASTTNVAVVLEGCLFGEIAFFIPHQRRIATVKAITSCEVLHISKHRWHELWAVNGDVSEKQVQKYALNSILDWVKDRVQRYQASCLKVAAKAKRHLVSRKLAATANGALAAASRKPHPPRLKRGQSLVTPELLLLEKKAKYLLAKADVFAAKHRQYVASIRAEGHSSARSHMSVRVTAAASMRESGDASRRHLPSMATSAFFTKKKKAPTKALDFAMQQFFVQVNPLNKHIRDQLSDTHVVLLETECWKRFTYLASVKNTVVDLMNELVSPLVARARQPQVDDQDLTPSSSSRQDRRSSVISRRISRRALAPIDTLKGARVPRPLTKMHSIHIGALRAAAYSPPEGRTVFQQSEVPAAATAAASPLGEAASTSKQPQPTHQFANLVGLAAKKQQLKSLGESQRVRRLARLARCHSLPVFDTTYFASVREKEEGTRRASRRATTGIESTLHKAAGIDFEILQRCKRPKFSTLYSLYRNYRRWKTGESVTGPLSIVASGSSVHERAQVPFLASQKVRASSQRRPSLGFRASARASISWERTLKGAAEHGGHSAATANFEEFLELVKRIDRLWDLAILLIAIYFSYSVPLKVCFVDDLVELPAGALRAWSGVEYLLDILCLLNLVRKVQQSSYFARIVLLREKKELGLASVLSLFRSVAADAAFRYDIIAVLPLDILIFALGAAVSSAEYPERWKHLCFLRLNKLLHITQIGPLSESVVQYIVYEMKVPIAEARLYFLRSLGTYLTMGHYIACVWYAASEKAYHTYGYSWLSTSGMLVSVSESDSSSGHSGTLDLTHVSLFRKYFRAMHFAIGSITTLFYADIVSMNLIELFTEIAVILWSIYIYGTLVGAHAEMQQFHSKHKAIFEQNLSELQHYLVLNGVPKALKRQVKQYYASIWRRRRGEDELSAIDGISRTLQEDVVFATMSRFAWRVSIFHSLDIHFLRALLVRLTYVICSESEEVVIRGDVDRTMYFISSGQILVKQDRFEITKEKGEFFGELALLYGVPRHETCVSLSTSELYRLDHEPYEELLLEFPEYRMKNKRAWTTTESSSSALNSILLAISMRAAPRTNSAEMQDAAALKALTNEDANPTPSIEDGSGGIAEERVTQCFVYRGTMELLAHLDKIDSHEAKAIISKARRGAREFMLHQAGIDKVRDHGDEGNDLDDVDSSRVARVPKDKVRNFDSTDHLPNAMAADDDDGLGVGRIPSTERSGGGSSQSVLFRRSQSFKG